MQQVSRSEYLAICHTHRYRHECPNIQSYIDFCAPNRHGRCVTSLLNRDAIAATGAQRLAAWDPRRIVRSAFGAVAAWALRQSVGEELATFTPNADVKQAFQGAQSMTVTNLNSLASSATAGWQSDAITNTSNLYLDDLFQIKLDFANTAPANSKAVFCFAYQSIDGGTTYTNPATGTEGTITLVDVTTTAQAMRLLGTMPYTTADEVAESAVMSMAATAGGLLPERYGMALINHTGAAIAASGNTVKHNGVFATVI